MGESFWYVDVNNVYVKLTVSPVAAVVALRNRYAGPTNAVVELLRLYSSSYLTEVCNYMPANTRNLVRFNTDGSINMIDKGSSSYHPTWVSFGKPKVNYAGKIVRFSYSGGTKPNSVRVVKVSTDNGNTLYGKDLEKGEDRSYLYSRVSGNIEVIA